MGTLEVSERVSVSVFHYIPSMFTQSLSAVTMSWAARLESWGLLDAQLLKLNFASFMIDLAVL